VPVDRENPAKCTSGHCSDRGDDEGPDRDFALSRRVEIARPLHPRPQHLEWTERYEQEGEYFERSKHGGLSRLGAGPQSLPMHGGHFDAFWSGSRSDTNMFHPAARCTVPKSQLARRLTTPLLPPKQEEMSAQAFGTPSAAMAQITRNS